MLAVSSFLGPGVLGVGFLNPMLLWALPLAAVPIIIHLLNRRRFQTVRWAAMEFLLRAMKRNRKRIQMQQWLVLLLRTLAVLLLVFLCTRPQLTGGVFGAGVRTHHVVVLDDSASMGQASGPSNVFQVGVKRVRALAKTLAAQREGDWFTLTLASAPKQAILAASPVGSQLERRLREALGSIALGDSVVDPAAVVEAVGDLATTAEGAGRTQVHWITDFRRVDWMTEGGDASPSLVDALRKLDGDTVATRVLDVGGKADPSHLAVVEVSAASRLAAVGVPMEFTVRVQNRGRSTTEPVEVALRIDQQTTVPKTTAPIAPGETAALTYRHVFRTAGDHGVEAVLPRDRYPSDDARGFALRVVESSRVVIVDGDPGDRPQDAESFYLAAALDPGGDNTSGVAVEVIEERALEELDLAAVDFLFLCNVPAPTMALTKRLEQYVESGGGLWIWLGNQVDPTRYNELLYQDGRGLLPVALDAVEGDLDRPEHVFLADPTHGSMAVATEVLEVLFARAVQVGRYFGVRTTPATDGAEATAARTVLRLRDSDGPPLLVSRAFRTGGEVLLSTTTVDALWTSWPREAAYQITLLEGHRSAMRPFDQSAVNLTPQQTLRVEVDPGRFQADARVRPLTDDGIAATVTARRDEGAEDGPLTLTMPMDELGDLGLHELVLIEHSGAEVSRRFARNTPLREGLLEPMTEAELRRGFPESVRERLEVVAGEDSAGDADDGAGETWRYLAFALIGVMLLETLLAWRFGKR